MRKSRPLYLVISGAVMAVMLTLTVLPSPVAVFAQGDVPAAETETPQPTEVPTETPTTVPTETPVGPTATPTTPATEAPPETAVPTETPVPATSTPVPPAPPAPVSIPEPITVVLFGTGLAALSAAAARRKNNASKGDE